MLKKFIHHIRVEEGSIIITPTQLLSPNVLKDALVRSKITQDKISLDYHVTIHDNTVVITGNLEQAAHVLYGLQYIKTATKQTLLNQAQIVEDNPSNPELGQSPH